MTEVAKAQEAGSNRGVQEEPVSPEKNASESVGPAISQPGKADGTGNPVLGRERRPLYRLSKSDVLEVSFAFASEFIQTVTVQPDGYITLKDAGHLLAEGLTAQELEAAIERAYAKLLHEPLVTVILKEFDRPYFIASGEVAHPGKYELRGNTTITAALAIAGGLTQQSKHSQVVLFRHVTPNLVETRVLNVKAMLKHRDLSEDPNLEAGDYLFVPRSRVSNIMRFMPATNMGMYANSPKFCPGPDRRYRGRRRLHMSDEATSRTGFRDAPSPTLRDVLAIMFRKRRVALFTFVAVMAATMVYAWWSPSYQAHMRFLLRRGRIDPVVTSQQNGPLEIARPEISEEELNSEVELLRDQELLQQVVEQNRLAADLQGGFHLSKNSPEVRVARATQRLARQLKIEPIRKSNVILVTYESSNPSLAARVLNSVARFYIDKHKEVRRSTQEFPFFEQQTDEARRRLNDSESSLVDFSRERGVISGSLERDLALQRAGEIESGAQQVRVAIEETTQRIQSLQSKLQSFPERSTSLIRMADNAELQGTLQAKLLELELKRTELLTRYEPSYRLVQEVQQQIDQAKAAIAAERLAPVHEETTEKDPNYEWAKSELEKAQVELSALRARETGIGAALTNARTQSRVLGEAAIRQQDLLRSMKTAEESYLLYARKSEEARIGDALDERGIVNAILAEPPVAPVLPKRSPWVVTLLGMVAAALASVVGAFAADYMDPSFRTPEEVETLLRAPVLASLPRQAA